MFYITGDKHGEFAFLEKFCKKANTTTEDVLIILGDAGINYYEDIRDMVRKEHLKSFPITLFCIHGNHEARPSTIISYKKKKMFGGEVYIDEEYPNQLFAIDGEVYNFNSKEAMVIGGAYSVDKEYRIARHWKWFADEQPSEEIKNKVRQTLKEKGGKVDIILSHTCPLRYEPVEWFLSAVDQSTVDKSTEIFLDDIEANTSYERWFCGHYHGEKEIDKMCFLFNSILTLC